MVGGLQFTLIFAVPSLNFLMHAFLHFAFEDASARRLIVPGKLQDVRRIDPVI